MSKTRKRMLHFLIAVILIGSGVAGMNALIAGKQKVKKRKPLVPVPAVRTLRVGVGPKRVLVTAEGTVRPLRESSLVSQVGGKVVSMSPALVNGGEFRHGETLLRIEPVDYELAVTLAEAKVKDAESALEMVEEESASAEEEWYLRRGGKGVKKSKPPPLVVKKPQLEAARARLNAAQAELRKAVLNLQRTELKAPFDGRVSRKNVDLGQYVMPGQFLASLYSIEAAEIVLPMDDEDLLWFHVPGFTPGSKPGSMATIRARIAGRECLWRGRVVRAEGKLDERTRMVNVVVRVDRPYTKKPPLAAGLFVTVVIEGRELPMAAALPRSALHQGNTVWIVDGEGLLRFRKVKVARLQGGSALIQSGLENGERVAITALSAVTDGMKVRAIDLEEGEL